DRPAAGQVPDPGLGHVGQMPAPVHRDQPAWQLAVVGVAAELPPDPLEPLRVQPHFGRVDLHLELGHPVPTRLFSALVRELTLTLTLRQLLSSPYGLVDR